MRSLRNENGLALLSALLSVALLTLIVVEMTDATFVHSHLTRNAGNAIAAQLLARSGQVGAEMALREARTNDQIRTFVDAVVEGAPLTLPTAQGHLMQIAIRDENARLNLNSLPDNEEAVANLFADLGLDGRLVDAVVARVDESEDGTLRDLSDDCSLAIPCDPTPGPLRSLDDLRTIRGFNDQIIAQLRPFATAYPGKASGTINLRTARPEVLQAIGCTDTENLPPLPRSQEDVDAWNDTTPCAAAKPGVSTSTSDVYTIVTTATVGEATQAVEAVVKVGSGPLSWKLRPVWGFGPVGVP